MSKSEDERLTVEREKDHIYRFSEFLKNYEKCWEQENEFHLNALIEKKKDYEHCMDVERQIQNLRVTKNGTETNSENMEKRIAEFDSRISVLGTAVRNKTNVNDDLSEQCRILEMETNKLEQAHRMLRDSRELYERYFGCSLFYEPPDVYNFLFLRNETKLGQIQFQYNELKRRWTVLGTQPTGILNEDILQKFNRTQDTQRLLCYFRQRLMNP